MTPTPAPEPSLFRSAELLLLLLAFIFLGAALGGCAHRPPPALPSDGYVWRYDEHGWHRDHTVTL